jgi:predicted Holliday junction resolvase-like endonuclease
MLWIGYIIISMFALGFAWLWAEAVKKEKDNVQRLTDLENAFQASKKDRDHWYREAMDNLDKYETELENNKTILSQKKSSETRIGQMTEHIVPFLDAFPYDPKNAHFLGQPIDFVVFDYDDGKIVFVEVKTGNAKESPRQKLIKNIVKSGRVYYETLRVNPKGVKTKKAENNE